MNSVIAHADTLPADAPRSHVLTLIEQLGLASGSQVSQFRFSPTFVVVSALHGWAGFRQNPDRRQPLQELERLCCELAGDPSPSPTLADRIEAALRCGRYACASTHFQAVMLRGTGDIRLRFQRAEMMQSLNALLALP
ncbi:MAG: hypothetical protein ACJ8R9_11290 [Steroidobacteraceae bacterium]